jgi:hypothetical protein
MYMPPRYQCALHTSFFQLSLFRLDTAVARSLLVNARLSSATILRPSGFSSPRLTLLPAPFSAASLAVGSGASAHKVARRHMHAGTYRAVPADSLLIVLHAGHTPVHLSAGRCRRRAKKASVAHNRIGTPQTATRRQPTRAMEGGEKHSRSVMPSMETPSTDTKRSP